MEEPLPEGDFETVLQNGVVLCKLINKLAPGSVKKFKEKVKVRKILCLPYPSRKLKNNQ